MRGSSRALVLGGLCLLLVIPAASPAQTKDPRGVPVLAEFPISREVGDSLIVPLKFQGHVYRFIVDTGSTLSHFDTSLRPHLGPPIRETRVRLPGGATTISLYAAPEARVGSLLLPRSELVGCVDFEQVRRVDGNDIRGILGMTFLREHVVELDFDRGRLSFLSGVPLGMGPPIPMFPLSDEGVPTVFAEIKGLGSKKYLIDTGHGGFGSGNLAADDFDLLLRQAALRPLKDGLASNLTRSHSQRNGRVKSARVQRFHVMGPHFGRGSVAMLGVNFWSRFIVVFDFPNDLMYLRESQAFDRDDVVDLSGLHLLRIDGRTVAEVVDRPSAAASAGIENGDVILKVDGDDASSASLQGLRRRLCNEGTVTLKVERGARVFDATMTLRAEGFPTGEAKPPDARPNGL